MSLVLSNLQEKFTVEDSLVELLNRTVEAALNDAGIKPDPEVGLVLTDDAYISELNKQYRNIDGPTDVLSFAMLEGEPVYDESDSNILGDVVISLERAVKQAEEYGHSFNREIAYLTVHGVLHLLGYDHGTDAEKKVMREKEEHILGLVQLLEG